MIVPTLGRVVWFTPGAHDLIATDRDGRCAAIVVRVWPNDRMVNLTVFDADGNCHSRTSVRLIQDDDQPGEGLGYCAWMPYQKGQAAKAEALEKQSRESQFDR
jgi:hypothetical protein